MIKFIMLFISSMWFGASGPEQVSEPQFEEIKIEFSEKALGIESGQPVYSSSTKIRITNPTSEKIKVFINDEEKKMKKNKLELSGLKQGTYTLMILAADGSEEEKKTVGFTIK